MDAVSLVALIVSVIALIGTILQLLQQYYSSAEGYSSCGEQVMGPWAQTRKRKFRYTELRFEVQFESPVIFVCPPTNQRGPVPGQPLRFVRGTRESEDETRTPSAENENLARTGESEVKRQHRVHTAQNERAAWFILLQALHTMERTSMRWQEERLRDDMTRAGPNSKTAQLPDKVAGWEVQSNVVALQPKIKSWDTMPSAVRKPYATTTICHLVELAAMLGLHWREFDRSNHKYRAEGNGFLLTGYYADELGIIFTFQIFGPNTFEANRIIPNEDVKMLAFGNVPTIFMEGTVKPFDNDSLISSGVLQFGGINELAESLTHYGCNTKTTNYFHDDKKKHGHLFPIVFEMIGMVAKSLYIPDTYYRVVPNPTTFHWNHKNFSMRKLLIEFNRYMRNDYAIQTYHIYQVQQWGEDLQVHLTGNNWKGDDNICSLPLLKALHHSIELCDAYLTDKTMSPKLVQLVIREHIQEVMKLLNEPLPTPTAHKGTGSDGSDGSGDDADDSTLSSKPNKGDHQAKHAFDELNAAAPEDRQRKLMDIYFTTVLEAVAHKCKDSLKKQATNDYPPTPDTRSMADPAAATSTDLGKMEGTGTTTTVTAVDEQEHVGATSPTPATRPDTPQLLVEGGDIHSRLRRMPTGKQEELAEEVWCTLMFRALCWLLLHDFHKRDVQISKSEMYGSRLPVYIA